MEGPGNVVVVQLGLKHRAERTEIHRGEEGRHSGVAEGEVPVDGAAVVLCSRVYVSDEVEDPVARGGEDAVKICPLA